MPSIHLVYVEIELKIGFASSMIHQNVVTRPIPSSSASSSHTGRSVKATRTMITVSNVLLQVPTSVTSFRHGFSGVLCAYILA